MTFGLCIQPIMTDDTLWGPNEKLQYRGREEKINTTKPNLPDPKNFLMSIHQIVDMLVAPK